MLKVIFKSSFLLALTDAMLILAVAAVIFSNDMFLWVDAILSVSWVVMYDATKKEFINEWDNAGL